MRVRMTETEIKIVHERSVEQAITLLEELREKNPNPNEESSLEILLAVGGIYFMFMRKMPMDVASVVYDRANLVAGEIEKFVTGESP